MLIVDIDIQDPLVNGQKGIIRHIEFAKGSVYKAYVKIKSEGSKAIKTSYLDTRNSY